MKILVIAVGCLVVMGCSKEDSESTGTSVSNLTGTLAISTFPSEPQMVQATNELGDKLAASPDARGAFMLALTKGHRYRLSVILADSSEPVVFPRTSGALDQSFRVSSGAALVALGSVRHLDSAPQGGFVVKSLSPPASGAAADTDHVECEDGIDANTGAACVDDDGALSCEQGDEAEGDNQSDGECENGVDATTGLACVDEPDDQADGECENGVDAVTGEACVDAEEADGAAPMAVAEHNVPDDVGGCDDSEQEGETDD